jgi:hypothetical protein
MELVACDELTLYNRVGIRSLVEAPAAKGVMTKRELLDMLKELGRRCTVVIQLLLLFRLT